MVHLGGGPLWLVCRLPDVQFTAAGIVMCSLRKVIEKNAAARESSFWSCKFALLKYGINSTQFVQLKWKFLFNYDNWRCFMNAFFTKMYMLGEMST